MTKQTKITKSARGQPCQIRIPGCDGGGETTVFCHFSLAGYFGKGSKAPDLLGAYGCYHCHQVVDGQKPRPQCWRREDVRLAFAEGCLRTLVLLEEQGLVEVA